MNKKKGPLLPTLLLLQGRLHKERQGKERQGMRGNRTKDPLSIGTFQKVFPIGILSLPLRNDSIPCVKPSLSLRLPPIYGPPPRQQPGPSHHQLPQSLPPPPRHEALPPPLPQRLPPIPPIPPRQPLPQSDSVGQSHGIPHFLPPPPWIGRHEGNQHRRIIQWLGVSPQNPIVLISTNTQDASQFPEYMDREVNPDFDFDDLHYSDIERSDLNDPPSPSNEGLLSSHPHTPSIISQQSIHPPSTPGLDAARASQIPVGAHLEHHGLMRLDLPVSPLSGADPDDPGNDDPPPSQPSPPHTPPPVHNPDPSQPSPSPPHTPPPPPVHNVPHHGRPSGPSQQQVT